MSYMQRSRQALHNFLRRYVSRVKQEPLSSTPMLDQRHGKADFLLEPLPSVFFANRTVPHEADLCIVMGTSLTVQPFASLPQMVEEDAPRLLINQEQVGDLGTRADDVLLLGDCDSGVRKVVSPPTVATTQPTGEHH
jgi:hypothetical protein